MTAAITFHVRAGKLGEVIGALDMLVDRMRAAPGCQGGRILADIDDSNLLLLASEWGDAESASAYFASPEFQIFRGLRILLCGDCRMVVDTVSRRVTKMLPNV